MRGAECFCAQTRARMARCHAGQAKLCQGRRLDVQMWTHREEAARPQPKAAIPAYWKTGHLPSARQTLGTQPVTRPWIEQQLALLPQLGFAGQLAPAFRFEQKQGMLAGKGTPKSPQVQSKLLPAHSLPVFVHGLPMPSALPASGGHPAGRLRTTASAPPSRLCVSEEPDPPRLCWQDATRRNISTP